MGEAAQFGTELRTVLVLDDEPIVLRLLDAILLVKGYEVIPTATVAEALQRFQRHSGKLCLLIIDIALSVMSGFEFLNRLPTLAPRVPVLFITGLGEREIEAKLPARCMLLYKPFTAGQLLRAVQTAIFLPQVSTSPNACRDPLQPDVHDATPQFRRNYL